VLTRRYCEDRLCERVVYGEEKAHVIQGEMAVKPHECKLSAATRRLGKLSATLLLLIDSRWDDVGKYRLLKLKRTKMFRVFPKSTNVATQDARVSAQTELSASCTSYAQDDSPPSSMKPAITTLRPALPVNHTATHIVD
jgi:hypothetical protein